MILLLFFGREGIIIKLIDVFSWLSLERLLIFDGEIVVLHCHTVAALLSSATGASDEELVRCAAFGRWCHLLLMLVSVVLTFLVLFGGLET